MPGEGERELARIIALQAGLALLNAEYAEEMRRMKQSAQESTKAKTGFLANLSHEIRGPLGIISNAVELVLDGLCGAITEPQKETLSMARTSSAHLLELINDVLDYAKVESGKMTPKTEHVLLSEILKDIAAVVRKQAESKHHRLVVQPVTEALAIACDRRHLRQMLINLLTNAIKYTPDGGVITMWAERAPAGKIRIIVRDTGVGIALADRDKVFSAFERIENAYAMEQVGTGLGMPLTKRLAEVNGGTIDFNSTPGKGSEFFLLFPSVVYDPAAVTAKGTLDARVSGRGEMLLLVESDNAERVLLEKFLTSLGFKVLAAPGTAVALELLREQSVQLAVIDNETVDRGAVIPLLHKSGGGREVPVVLLSSKAFTFDVEEALGAGVARCLSKPVSLGELALTCRMLIDSGG